MRVTPKVEWKEVAIRRNLHSLKENPEGGCFGKINIKFYQIKKNIAFL